MPDAFGRANREISYAFSFLFIPDFGPAVVSQNALEMYHSSLSPPSPLFPSERPRPVPDGMRAGHGTASSRALGFAVLARYRPCLFLLSSFTLVERLGPRLGPSLRGDRDSGLGFFSFSSPSR